MTKDPYIPIWQYAEEKGVKIQTVYRWIREQKFKKEDIETRIKKVKRIEIKQSAKPDKKFLRINI